METSQILHIVDECVRGRAEQARLAFDLGMHAEVYSDANEFCERPPARGVILANDRSKNTLQRILSRFESLGVWLPVIATAEEPRPGRVVEVVRQGVLDYLSLPLRPARLEKALETVSAEERLRGESHRRALQARSTISSLTHREREVLDWLVVGYSNKLIARELGISPRTVEIHRANMMTKIRATSVADAVRLRMEAGGAPDGVGSQRPAPVEGHEPVARIERRPVGPDGRPAMIEQHRLSA